MAAGTDRERGTAESGWGAAYVRMLDASAGRLWLLAILLYVCGDVLTTAVGLWYTPLVEVGPLPEFLLVEFGVGAVAGLKLGILALFAGVWRLLPRPVSAGVPLGLSLVGYLVTLWNGTLIVLVVT
ncbi:MAG: hypothetical protein ACI9K3_001649 [Halovenus sp.]|jgi:hypothetical protein